jgi:hypothetical protein
MKIKSNTDEVVITINRKEMSIDLVEQFVKTLRYKELVSKSSATERQVEEITRNIKKGIGKKVKQMAEK